MSPPQVRFSAAGRGSISAPASRRVSVVVNQNRSGRVRVQKECEGGDGSLTEADEDNMITPLPPVERNSPTPKPAVKRNHFDLSAGQLQEIREVFNLFDTDGSGTIDLAELRIVMRALGFSPSKEDLIGMAAEFQVDDDPSLSFEEFLFLMARKLSEKDAHTEMMKSFTLFDIEGRGKIGPKELRRVAKEIGEYITDDEIDMIIEETDKDGDGEIGEADWVRVQSQYRSSTQQGF
ncbi:Centrin-4 [Irineochytrium annulatum]|nr:Centrin-4 [Irineochytrium annulatum]